MNQFIRKISAIFFWIGLWAIAAAVINKPLLLPSPINVALRIASLISTTTFWSTTILSLLRIMTGIISAVLLGVVLGYGVWGAWMGIVLGEIVSNNLTLLWADLSIKKLLKLKE